MWEPKLYPVLRPFFRYFGSKWLMAKRYPRPKCKTIIEPFAGSACYSLHYPAKQVKLYDINPIICGVWDYLIKSKESEILALPLDFEDVKNTGLCQEARWLVGFWLQPGSRNPGYRKCKRNEWNRVNRQSIADNLKYIRHWTIHQLDYKDVPPDRVTWFIDPPYQGIDGKEYDYNTVIFRQLANWVQQLEGQIIVCEQDGADWLHFKHLHTRNLTGGTGIKQSVEMMYYRERNL